MFDAAVKGMNASLDHIAGIADLKAALEKHPDAFNVIGKLYMTATDFADFIRKPEVAEFFGGAEIQKTVAKRIEFVKTVKDQIFDDPRLSDQDLRLIIQYIAVLNDKTIGTSRAFAALNSLEQVMINSIAKNTFIAKPGLAVTNGRGPNGEYLDAFDVNTVGIVSRIGDDASSLRSCTFYVKSDDNEYVDAALNDLVIYGLGSGTTPDSTPTINPS